jgi:NitT/TauT family transport system permease protein
MMSKQKLLESLAPWLILAGVVAAWQLIVSGFGVSEFIFPGPVAIIRSLATYAGPIGQHAWQTFWSTMIGFGLGIGVGVILGLIVGSSRLMFKGLYPLMVGFNSIPKVAFVPVLVVWFGIGTVPAVLTALLLCFFPIVVNVATGLATLEPELEDVLRALGATRLDILRKVGIPRSLPYFFASLKVAVTLAFVGTVLSETVAANSGIGYLMMSAGSSMKLPLLFAGLTVISVMAMATFGLIAALERHMTGWAHRGQMAQMA